MYQPNIRLKDKSHYHYLMFFNLLHFVAALQEQEGKNIVRVFSPVHDYTKLSILIHQIKFLLRHQFFNMFLICIIVSLICIIISVKLFYQCLYSTFTMQILIIDRHVCIDQLAEAMHCYMQESGFTPRTPTYSS